MLFLSYINQQININIWPFSISNRWSILFMRTGLIIILGVTQNVMALLLTEDGFYQPRVASV